MRDLLKDTTTLLSPRYPLFSERELHCIQTWWWFMMMSFAFRPLLVVFSAFSAAVASAARAEFTSGKKILSGQKAGNKNRRVVLLGVCYSTTVRRGTTQQENRSISLLSQKPATVQTGLVTGCCKSFICNEGRLRLSAKEPHPSMKGEALVVCAQAVANLSGRVAICPSSSE